MSRYILIIFSFFSSTLLVGQKLTVYDILKPYFGNLPIEKRTNDILHYITKSNEFKTDSVSYKDKVFYDYTNNDSLIQFLNVNIIFGRSVISEQTIFFDSLTLKNDTVDYLNLSISFDQNVDVLKLQNELHNKIKKVLKVFKQEENGIIENYTNTYKYYSSKKDKGYFIMLRYFKKFKQKANAINISIVKLASYNK